MDQTHHLSSVTHLRTRLNQTFANPEHDFSPSSSMEITITLSLPGDILGLKPFHNILNKFQTVMAYLYLWMNGQSSVAHLAPTRTTVVPSPVVSSMTPTRSPCFGPSPFSWTTPLIVALTLIFIVVSSSSATSRSVAR